MQKYAERHEYDFRAIWYDDIDPARFPEFRNPEPFVQGAVNYVRRRDFIRWRLDRSLLAPNWLRYAAVIQLLDEYDIVVYFDADLVIADFETDIAAGIPSEKWLAAPICGPSPDNAGPGRADVHHAQLFALARATSTILEWCFLWQEMAQSPCMD